MADFQIVSMSRLGHLVPINHFIGYTGNLRIQLEPKFNKDILQLVLKQHS